MATLERDRVGKSDLTEVGLLAYKLWRQEGTSDGPTLQHLLRAARMLEFLDPHGSATVPGRL